MSDQVSAAAAAMGIPESLVERSAAARAAETDATTEEIIAAWAGGEAAPSAAAAEPQTEAAEPEETEEVADETPADEPAPAPEIVVETPAQQTPPEPAVPAGPYKPPVLVGAGDNPMMFLSAVVGLFVAIFLVGFVGPSFQGEAPGARTSEIAYSENALEGREVYADLNCDACHTQMVRPVIADIGLGAVSVHDSNQVIGTRRFGPDLSNVGARMSASQLAAVVDGLGEHPSFSLAQDDLDSLVAYLAESVTSEESDE